LKFAYSSVAILSQTKVRSFLATGELIKYSSKNLPKEFLLKHKTKKIEIPKMKQRWEKYLDYLNKQKKQEIVILFINKGFFRIFWPPAIGIACKNKVILNTVFPIKIPAIEKFLLKKCVLHEINHHFELTDSLFNKFSIMDYGTLLFTSRFTKSQLKKIKEYQDQKKKLGYYLEEFKFKFLFFSFKIK